MGVVPKIVVVSTSITCSMLPVALVAVLGPNLERQFKLGPGTVGVLSGTTLLVTSLSAVVFGPISDRIGGSSVLAVATLILGLGLLVVALSREVLEVGVGLVICGGASGAIGPAGYQVIWETARGKHQGLAFGAAQAGYPLATVLAGFAAPEVAEGWGWRSPFLLGCVLVLACAVSLRLGPSVRPRVDASCHLGASREVSAKDGTEWAAQRRSRPRLVAGSILGNCGTSALTTYFVLFMVWQGTDELRAGLLFAVGGCTSVVARLALGAYSDRSRRDLFQLVGALLICGSIGVLLLSARVPWLLGPAMVLGFGVGWGWSGLLSFAVVQAFAATPARMAGLVVTAAGCFGAAIGPLGFGVALSHVGYSKTWLGVAGCLGASALLMVPIAGKVKTGGDLNP